MENGKNSKQNQNKINAAKSIRPTKQRPQKFSEIPHLGWIILAMILYHYARKENTNG